MLKHSFNFIFIVLSALAIVGCQFKRTYLNSEEDKKDAEKVAQSFFESVKHKNYDSSMVFFSDRFFEVTSKDKLVKMFEMENKKLGNLKEISLSKSETSRTEGTNPSGSYELQYINTYDSAQATETIRMTLEKDKKIKILAYNINSDAFLK
jgi:hypothetical protein